MNKKITFTLCGLALVGIGILAGIFVFEKPTSSSSSSYPFINPTVTSNLDKHFIINFKELKKEFIEIQKRNPQKTYIYFAYLNNASWVGLGERDSFTAASTVKVPLAMSVLRAVEDGKVKLSDSYTLDELDLDSNFGDLYKVGIDKTFTVEELMRIMLERSDNTAATALINVMGKIGIQDPFGDIYLAMGWDFFSDLGTQPDYQLINLKTLSTMFLSLYNATYVNLAHSNMILDYLAHSPFSDKIASGVPDRVVVSHKIGIASNNKTFSDCGIVYAPKRDYVLCVGSDGVDEKLADHFMSEVSKAAYQYVINN